MTTVIACRSQLSMVADTRVSHGDGKFTSRKKIQKVGKYLAGVAGDYGPALTYLKVFASAARDMDGKSTPMLPAYEGEFELMVLSEYGLWLYTNDGSTIEIEEDFYAIGTGGNYAGACLRTQELLLQPCNVAMAAEIACEFDTNSGLPLIELRLSPRKKTRDTA